MVARLGLKQPATRQRGVLKRDWLWRKAWFPFGCTSFYVLESAMEVVSNLCELKRYLQDAVVASDDSPVLLDPFSIQQSKLTWMR